MCEQLYKIVRAPVGMMGRYMGLLTLDDRHTPTTQEIFTTPVNHPSSYRGEIFAIFLVATFATSQLKIFSDCKGAIKANQGTKIRVLLGYWIHKIRESIAQKQLILSHVVCHVGIYVNKCADQEAKQGLVVVTPSLPQTPQE
uniref:Uncharacterized protein n=1 Tax=Eutreptiella gymnastica TaxID=73025 RepID=A0A7S1HUB1_9EUGL|mmetsp:Transcript_105315/g.181647  ORF Transcript_105315/g.181647 Transcript_105315/m.181647 type:complete len:142 (+) Transcript_105315:161-586(+)